MIQSPKGTCKHTERKSGLWKGFHEANCKRKGTTPKIGAKQSFKQTTGFKQSQTSKQMGITLNKLTFNRKPLISKCLYKTSHFK